MQTAAHVDMTEGASTALVALMADLQVWTTRRGKLQQTHSCEMTMLQWAESQMCQACCIHTAWVLPCYAVQAILICSSRLQAGEYLEAMLASSTPGCVFEAAQALLQLARLQSAAPNSGCYNAVSGAAAAWAAVAVAALLQLWDRQLSTAGHAQIMDVLCQHLDCLQVGTGPASWLLQHCRMGYQHTLPENGQIFRC